MNLILLPVTLRWKSAGLIRSRRVSTIRFTNANANAQKRDERTREAAEILAIEALTYLTTDPEALSRFLALAGLGPATLRQAAADPGFLAGVLDHFLGNEELLRQFANGAGIAPEEIARARAALGA